MDQNKINRNGGMDLEIKDWQLNPIRLAESKKSETRKKSKKTSLCFYDCKK